MHRRSRSKRRYKLQHLLLLLKLRALQESGTANPHAHAVQDPAFVDSDFFDSHDLIQVRYEMLRRVRTEGQSVTKATTLFGVSRPTSTRCKAISLTAVWWGCSLPSADRAALSETGTSNPYISHNPCSNERFCW